ncbi:MAG: hypothetical protein M3021_02540, partial [Actinomycetota bacterium]|nr:hypothetical protein [Actinomycetota bacterium]
MSPEQADLSNRGLGPATDVYSLGVVLYELLCGALPFDADRLREAGFTEILKIIREEEPPLPRARLRQPGPSAENRARQRRTSVAALEHELSGDLASIVQTALAKDPRERYSSASDLASDLERYLRDEPVRAHAPGRIYRWRKLAHRRRGLLLSGAAASAVLVLAAYSLLSSRGPRPVPRVTPLTSYSGYEFGPALSPDGKRLAFVWNGGGKNYDIYVKPVEAGDPVRLTTNSAHDLHPTWSPDGRFIAFLRTSPSESEVLIVPASGGSERRVARTSARTAGWEPEASIIGRSPGPAWSPDGASLAIADRAVSQGPDCIYLVSPQAGVKRKLTSPEPQSLGDSLPAFSPSGSTVAFVRAVSQRGITDIYTIAASGGEAKRITSDGKTVTGLAWASERHLVFTSNRNGGQMLWSVPAHGGAPELIAPAGRSVTEVSAANSLGRLVLGESFRNTNIWRADLSRPGTPAEKLIATTRRNDSPKYSPDGRRIVFGSDRSGAYEIWVSDSDGSHARRITSFGGTPVGTPRWSPDGRQIVFDAGKDRRSAIYIVNEDGGTPRLWVEEPWDCMMPSWSRDGRFIYFVSRRPSEDLRLWKKPVDGGPAVQLTHRAGGEAVEAPDGTLVYFSDGRNGIWQVSPDGTNEKPAPGLENVRHSRYFTITGRGLY